MYFRFLGTFYLCFVRVFPVVLSSNELNAKFQMYLGLGTFVYLILRGFEHYLFENIKTLFSPMNGMVISSCNVPGSCR